MPALGMSPLLFQESAHSFYHPLHPFGHDHQHHEGFGNFAPDGGERLSPGLLQLPSNKLAGTSASSSSFSSSFLSSELFQPPSGKPAGKSSSSSSPSLGPSPFSCQASPPDMPLAIPRARRPQPRTAFANHNRDVVMEVHPENNGEETSPGEQRLSVEEIVAQQNAGGAGGGGNSAGGGNGRMAKGRRGGQGAQAAEDQGAGAKKNNRTLRQKKGAEDAGAAPGKQRNRTPRQKKAKDEGQQESGQEPVGKDRKRTLRQKKGEEGGGGEEGPGSEPGQDQKKEEEELSPQEAEAEKMEDEIEEEIQQLEEERDSLPEDEQATHDEQIEQLKQQKEEIDEFQKKSDSLEEEFEEMKAEQGPLRRQRDIARQVSDQGHEVAEFEEHLEQQNQQEEELKAELNQVQEEMTGLQEQMAGAPEEEQEMLMQELKEHQTKMDDLMHKAGTMLSHTAPPEPPKDHELGSSKIYHLAKTQLPSAKLSREDVAQDLRRLEYHGLPGDVCKEAPQTLRELKTWLLSFEHARLTGEPIGPAPPLQCMTGLLHSAVKPQHLGADLHKLTDAMHHLVKARQHHLSPDKIASMTSEDMADTLVPVAKSVGEVLKAATGVKRWLESVEKAAGLLVLPSEEDAARLLHKHATPGPHEHEAGDQHPHHHEEGLEGEGLGEGEEEMLEHEMHEMHEMHEGGPGVVQNSLGTLGSALACVVPVAPRPSRACLGALVVGRKSSARSYLGRQFL